MRLTICALGVTLLDITLTDGTEDEPEFEAYQDAGTIGSDRIVGEHGGFDDAGLGHQYGPGEGDEEASRIGFRR